MKLPKPLSKLEETFATHLRSGCMPSLPEREVKFHPTRKWRFDFAWPDKKLAVEIEGGVYSGGRHTRAKGFIADCEKYNEAAALGWTVLRFTADEVKSLKAINMTRKTLLGIKP